jgi:hypothetical protein
MVHIQLQIQNLWEASCVRMARRIRRSEAKRRLTLFQFQHLRTGRVAWARDLQSFRLLLLGYDYRGHSET